MADKGQNKILFLLTVEIDAEGNKVIVQRARNVDGSIYIFLMKNVHGMKMVVGCYHWRGRDETVENEDLNSDIYKSISNSNPDNHKIEGEINDE
jgi:hypothetical protein